MPKFTDVSPMPFGTHKGSKLEQVPASYLLWLADKMADDDDKVRLFIYVQANRSILEQEAKGEKDSKRR